MAAASIPLDESDRKRVLDVLDVLDSLPEAFSNAVAAAAAAIAGVPISAVSLVDTERQWFKASCGLDVGETSRDVSFCAHAILGREPFLVNDARADPRFSNNPLVTGAPFIRAYAGFPLLVAGQAIGALCVIDDRPRQFTADQVTQLSGLAAGTSAWLSERGSMSASLSRTEQELRYVTLNDAVTRLPNRLLFEDRLQLAGRRQRPSGFLGVLFVDIDGFKRLTDALGDKSSDSALREIARRLSSQVGAGDTVARVGGDQFLVLVESRTSDDLARLARQIRVALSQPLADAHHRASLSASIGISTFPADGPLERMVANADTAMLEAKRAGGNDFRFFEATMDALAQSRVELLDDLRAASARRELALHYQPKVHAHSGLVTGVEALLRWHHPQRGLISPAVFIPLAERTGLIKEIGHWVILEACRQMQIWSELGIRMRVAINLSVQQLDSPTIAGDIAAALERFAVEPSLLTCEITESVAMNNAAAALEVFERIRAVGVHLSIDDFGTGYSSLSYLRRLPVHQLKIDRSFVIDLGESEDARVVASAIVNLAHALRLEVVAEGVETAQQRDILLALGCDKFQGYLFAKPMTAAAFTEWALDRGVSRPEAFRPSIFADTLPS